MKAFFRHHGRYNDEMMAATREKAKEIVCRALHGKEKTEISDAYFEYMVDNTIWYNWATLNDMGPVATPLPEWPWPKAKPAPFDMTEGASGAYAQWLADNAPADDQEMPPADPLPAPLAQVDSELTRVLSGPFSTLQNDIGAMFSRRESAMEQRFQDMEAQVRELRRENQALRQENQALRERLN
ncbi:hypothetical protein CDV31_006280 [Fusarium ambrosium]|uniref:Uncharacterized protein n=1 Tax=Fusarium ambrosium TaxID=131363 RepID=A0A428UDR3_9HYPO|nr:hypothetical protein CDV31_006280 [Fusarium ambrosium]